jgi:hypothetical protein
MFFPTLHMRWHCLIADYGGRCKLAARDNLVWQGYPFDAKIQSRKLERMKRDA